MRIIILTCNTGQGHNSAARALFEEFTRRGADVEVHDTLAFGSEFASEVVAGALVKVAVNMPRAFGFMYGAAELISSDKLKSPVYLANAMYADNLQQYLDENGFDAAVCPHLFPAEALTFLKRRRGLEMRCYYVSTDYACIPFLEETDMDLTFIPDESLKRTFTERGMPEDKLFVSGIPVASSFRAHLSRSEARAETGIPMSSRAYLVMTGGEGCGNPIAITESILKRDGGDVRVAVLPGRNAALMRSLEERFGGDERVMLVSFTDRVPVWMDACDVLLTKPGGISSTEGAVHGIPIIHTAPIPGVETQNARFFSERGMSVLAGDEDNTAENAYRLATDEGARRRMIEAQRQYVPADPAKTIADLILG